MILNGEKLIQKGLNALVERRLRILENAIKTGEKEIYRKVDKYFDAERIVEQEEIDISKYRSRYHELIGLYHELEKKKGERKDES